MTVSLLCTLPNSHAVAETLNVKVKVDGELQNLYANMPLSELVEGQMQFTGSIPLPNIDSFTITIDGSLVASGFGSGTPGPLTFTFYVTRFTNGQHNLVVTVQFGEEKWTNSSSVLIRNPPTPNYSIKVNIYRDETYIPLENGSVLSGDVDCYMTVYKDGVVVPFESAVIRFEGEYFTNTGGGENIYFSFTVEHFDDGFYNLEIDALLPNDTHVIFTARVLVQNRNPVLLVLGIACFVIAVITFVMQVRKSKRRSAVALTTAKAPQAWTPARMAPGMNARVTSRRPGGRIFTTSTPPDAEKTIKNLKRRTWKTGWKTWMPLASLVGIFVVLTTFLAQTPSADIGILFGEVFAPPIPLVMLVAGIMISGFSFLKWRTSAGKGLGAFLHIFVVMGSIYAMGRLFLNKTALSGLGADPMTVASILIVVSTTMLSWLAAPPPAAVLALRFSRWGRTPGVPHGSPKL